MPIPKQTSEIFDILSKGQFICSNSSDANTRKLYNVIDDNFEDLLAYFQHINLVLERGDEHYHFSRKEGRATIERKLETAYKWIDIVDFLKTYDASFGSGYRFSPAEILVKLSVDADLKNKLEGLKKYAGGKEKHAEILDKILDTMLGDNYIDRENDITGAYKTLASFNYLEQLILSINIPQEVQHEIPQ